MSLVKILLLYERAFIISEKYASCLALSSISRPYKFSLKIYSAASLSLYPHSLYISIRTSNSYKRKCPEPTQLSRTLKSLGSIFSSIYSTSPFFGITKNSSLSFKSLSGFRSIQYLPNELSTIYLTIQSGVNSCVAAGISSLATFPL